MYHFSFGFIGERVHDVLQTVKLAHKLAEDVRVAMRNVRRDSNEKIKSLQQESDISEDERDVSLKKIQEITDGHIARVEELLGKKEKEIMEV